MGMVNGGSVTQDHTERRGCYGWKAPGVIFHCLTCTPQGDDLITLWGVVIRSYFSLTRNFKTKLDLPSEHHILTPQLQRKPMTEGCCPPCMSPTFIILLNLTAWRPVDYWKIWQGLLASDVFLEEIFKFHFQFSRTKGSYWNESVKQQVPLFYGSPQMSLSRLLQCTLLVIA